MNLDELDMQVLKENFDDDMIFQLDFNNVYKIMKYLDNNGVYYYKDIFLSSLDLFLWPYSEFVDRFEILKNKLGSNYVDLLGEDCSLIEIMYED